MNRQQFYQKILISLQIFAIAAAFFLVVPIMLYAVLPFFTRQGDRIAVPDLRGLSEEEAAPKLKQIKLRYCPLKTASYTDQYPPNRIVSQDPLPGSTVKRNRCVYLTINAEAPPKVRMPDLVHGSVKDARLRLQRHGLKLGKITYKVDIAKHAVLEQFWNDSPIIANTMLPRGSVIDLVVGTGLLKTAINAPSLISCTLTEAEQIMCEQKLNLGSVIHVYDKQALAGEAASNAVKIGVVKQRPAPGSPIRLGDIIDVWLGVVPAPTQTEPAPAPHIPQQLPL